MAPTLFVLLKVVEVVHGSGAIYELLRGALGVMLPARVASAYGVAIVATLALPPSVLLAIAVLDLFRHSVTALGRGNLLGYFDDVVFAGLLTLTVINRRITVRVSAG